MIKTCCTATVPGSSVLPVTTPAGRQPPRRHPRPDNHGFINPAKRRPGHIGWSDAPAVGPCRRPFHRREPTGPCGPLPSIHHGPYMRRHRIVDRRALLLDLGDLLGHARKPLPQPIRLRANPDGLGHRACCALVGTDRSHPDLRDHGLSSTGLPYPATTNSQTGFRNTLSSVKQHDSFSARASRSCRPSLGIVYRGRCPGVPAYCYAWSTASLPRVLAPGLPLTAASGTQRARSIMLFPTSSTASRDLLGRAGCPARGSPVGSRLAVGDREAAWPWRSRRFPCSRLGARSRGARP